MMVSLLPALSLGFVLGLRHATDPDHVVAVSTMIRERSEISTAARLGTWWGLGHMLPLLTLGGAMVVLGVTLPPRVGLALELGVAVMLIALGARAWSKRSHADHRSSNARPLAMGVIHGLAGSGAAALLVLGSVEGATARIAYLTLFGVGTVAGMVCFTGLLSLPLRWHHRAPGWLRYASAGASICLGLYIGFELIFTNGLLSATPEWSPR